VVETAFAEIKMPESFYEGFFVLVLLAFALSQLG
jgi:hypothetical protein